ncbi:LacI family DNA-binding transcriptional regulator [Aureimonas psammosilenae]|uniref:LacI family DNA-binding transcriptional regulator n=1 Tax=Aureimonas psammosilenae TaxID=2495496 RepID=UPI001F304617|nr:LacI family DNA-binding transcriptional regulator [Aureimonas psammosilenae]
MSEAASPSVRKARRKGSAVTMAEVAAAAGVSMQTVSRALRAPGTVTAETRQAIEAAIEKTHYVQNLAASHLASARSNTVAAIIPTLSASVFAETIQHFSQVLNAANYQIFLGNTDYRPDREEAVVRSLLGRRPDGVFVIGTQHTRACTGLLRRAGIPVVEGWDQTRRPIDGLVGFSNEAAIAAMAKHLADTGRRRIVFAGVLRRGDARAAERRDGFLAAMATLFPGEAPRLCIAADLPLAMESGACLLERVRAEHVDADAVMFSSDVIAAGALLAAGRQGIAVPGEIAITGFGDFELARHLNPALTTVAVPAATIGREAGRLLLEGMSGRPLADKRIDVGFRLMIRDSA